MTKHRHALPQLGNGLLLTDGGLETTLVFHQGWELPHFAAFPLTETAKGRAALKAYYDAYARMATSRGLGFVLETPTWRANPDWAAKLGWGRDRLAASIRDAVELLQEVRWNHESRATPFVVSGNIGPRGDGYVVECAMTVAEAQDYHDWQVRMFRDTEVDMVSAFTMTSSSEALGIARAAAAHGMPCVISFTVEIDGRLPSGEGLGEAIQRVEAGAEGRPAYYMVNCAHPSHFAHVIEPAAPWAKRIGGIRANASCRSHAELDAAPDLDRGDPTALGQDYAALRRLLPAVTVLGGCCGTDEEHIESVAEACTAGARSAAA